MPGSLGGLVVSLGLNAVEFTTGLTKAERDAQKFAQSVQRGVAQIAAVVGSLGLGAIFTSAAKEIISSAAALDDLADATGSSVESLSKLANQAAISGKSFDDLQGALLKLSAGMGGVDEDSNKVLRALRLLGISATDPAQALQEIAVKFNQFADGARKAAFARDLFGKSGPAFLATLKDIAETQDVAATTSAKQAAEAENLEKAFRRLSVEATTFKNAILVDVVPALNAMVGSFGDAVRGAGGLLKALGDLASSGQLLSAEDPGESVRRLNKELDELNQLKQAGGKSFLGIFTPNDITNLEQNIARVSRALDIAKAAQRRAAQAIIDPSNQDVRDFLAQRKPQLPPLPSDTKRGGAAALSEAQRYLESLQKQLEATQDLSTETRVLNEIRERGLVGLTPALEAQILAVAREIDAEKALKKAIEESRKAFEEERRASEEAQKQRDKDADSAADAAQHIIDGNKALADEIEVIKGGDAARAQLEQRRIQDAINIAEQARALALLDPLRAVEADNIRIQIEALQKRQALLLEKGFAEQMRKDAEELQAFKNIFADTFADAFASFIDGSKSAKDAFTDFAKSVERQISRLAAQKIGDALFGGTSGSSGIDIGKIIGMLLGAAGGGGGSWISGGDIGGLAGGTSFWRGGPTVVGESGPEVVNLPRGASVVPNEESQKMFGPRMNFVINVLPGASTKTAQQAAAMTGVAVQRAMVRNT